MAVFGNANSPARRLVREDDRRLAVIRVVLVLCFLLGSGVAHALDPARFLSQYGHTAWRLQDGELPSPVYPIAQSNDGYLWIGTQAGVLRFDGVRFIPLDRLADKSLSDPFVVSLLGASDGSLWVGTRKGLSRWDQGRLVDYTGAESGAFSLREDQRGKIWFATYSHEEKPLCEVEGTRVSCHGDSDGLKVSGLCCEDMVTDRQGTFWLSTDTALVRWLEGARSESFTIDAKAKSGSPGRVVLEREPSGELWVGLPAPGAGLGLQRLVMDRWQPFVTPDVDGSMLATQALFRDRNNALWVGTIDHGVYRILADRVDHFDRNDGLSSDCIYYFFEDRAGNMWVATSNGVDRFRDLRVGTYTTREGLSVSEVDSVLAARDGKIWVGLANGLDILDHGQVRSIRSGKELPGGQPTSIIEDNAGRIWVGIDSGLWIYAAGKFTPVPGQDGQALGFVRDLAQDTEQNIWATLRTKPAKIVRIRDAKVVEEFVDPAVPPVRSLAADPREGIWLGLMSGDLAHLRPSGLETFAFHLDGEAVRQVMVASNSVVYGATEKGLMVLNHGVTRLLKANDGLPCDTVYGFVEGDNQALWLYMSCGLAKVQSVDIERVLQGSQRVIAPELLDVFDGARPGRAPFERAARAPDGTLWFANGVSLQTMDPHRVVADSNPPVYVEQLVADRKAYTVPNLALPPLTRDVQIDYTAPELAIPQRVRFRYRLEGHDQEWTDAAARRQAFYTDLPPGEYQFRVAASEGGGRWSEVPSRLKFSILPAFYQTGWFMALVVAAASTALWMLFAWRLARVKVQVRALLEERLAERERIARELHDTFLQGVQGLMLRFQSAMERIPPSQPARELMEKALDHADTVLAEGRDRVTQLRSMQRSASDLPNALQIMGEEFAREGHVAFRLTVEGSRRELEPVVSDEVQRIVGEALANAFRHAHAKQIDVGVTYTRKQLTISVVDDGGGFDVDTVGKYGPAGHWGLQGMQERATKIRARIELSSGPGIGTAVELAVPAAIAFRRSSKLWRRWLNTLRWESGRREDTARTTRDDQQSE